MSRVLVKLSGEVLGARVGGEESACGSEESARGSEESARGSEESACGSGESACGSGESARGSGESARGSGESARGSGESARGSEESACGSGENSGVLDADMLDAQAREIAEAAKDGIQIALVIGGGNIVRGDELKDLGLHRITADQMGMLATIINALAFRDAVERHGIPAEVLCAHAIPTVAEGYSARRARALLAEGRVVLLSGGTGNPLFTTDTAACLRAIEIDADLVVKATKVDGVYSANPATDPEAKRFDQLTFDEVLRLDLKVMDLPAICLCRDHALPIAVCNMTAPGTLTKVMHGAKVGTRIEA